MDHSRLGEPVNTATGPQGARPSAAERQVMGTGAAITVIAVGAILRFALPAGSPHSLNVHVVGVVLILVGVLGLLLSLLARAGPRRPHSLIRQNRGRYHDLPGPPRLRDVSSRESRQARRIKVLLRTLAAVPPRYPRGQRQGPEFFNA